MKERLAKMLNNPVTIPLGIGIIAFNAGVGLGYFLWNRKVETYDIATSLKLSFDQDEIKRLKDIAERSGHPLVIREERPDINVKPERGPGPVRLKSFHDLEVVDHHDGAPTEVVVARVLAETPKRVEVLEESEAETVRRSVFASTDDDWNYSLEIRNRSENEPYVIHKDEFYSNEKDYEQSTLTYYVGDDILVNQDDSPMYDHETQVGPLLFGHGSGDPNVVHVRNDKRKEEWEILRDPGLYSVEVLGLDIEHNTRVEDLKHSSRTGRFRQD